MKLGLFLCSLLLLPLTAMAEDTGFSYQSSDGTIYTSTTAPSFCKRYYQDVNEPRSTYLPPSSMPYACANPMFTTSRGSLKKKSSRVEVSDFADSEDDSGSYKKNGRIEARVPPAPKKREKHWWEWRSDPDEPLRSDGYDSDANRPPAHLGRSRTHVEKETEITLTPVTEGDDEEVAKKNGRIKVIVPPTPRAHRESRASGRKQEIEIFNNGKDGRDGEDGDSDDFGGKGDKKGGRIVAKQPPAPHKRVVIPVDPGSEFDPGLSKKDSIPKAITPPAPRRTAQPKFDPNLDDDFGNGSSGKGDKGGRIEARVPPLPPKVILMDPGYSDGNTSNFEGKGKKGDRFTAKVPPAPAGRSRVNVADDDLSAADIAGLRARLQPIRVIPPSGKVKPYAGANDHHVIALSPEEAFCINNTQPSDMIPGQPFFVDISRRIVEKLPAPRLTADKNLLEQLRKKTPEQEQCASDAPKNPSRIVLAFDSFASFDYEDFYKRNNTALPAKEAEAFKKGSAISSAARREDRQVPGVHWKYYPKENTEKEELSPAVRCAFELATKSYTNKKGEKVYNTISLVAHSYGGDAVGRVANTLKKLGVRVDLVLTTDPRQANREQLQRPANTDRWVNFYQTNDPILRGFPVDGADNVNISEGGAWHGQAPQDAMVRARASKEMMELPRCKSDLTTSVYQQSVSCD